MGSKNECWPSLQFSNSLPHNQVSVTVTISLRWNSVTQTVISKLASKKKKKCNYTTWSVSLMKFQLSVLKCTHASQMLKCLEITGNLVKGSRPGVDLTVHFQPALRMADAAVPRPHFERQGF